MLAIAVCIFAFLLSFVAARYALWAGVATTIGWGYLYGILRANIEDPVAQFVFDAALGGLFLATVARRTNAIQRLKLRGLIPWVICLVGWPTALLLVPSQHLLIQLVGWRASVLFVPFIFYGSMLEKDGLLLLAKSIAVLNLLVFVVAIAETLVGVPFFYPFNAVDAIIYKSTDVIFDGENHYRIPGTFTHAAAYATCMVGSMPLLLGALSVERKRKSARYLLFAASGAAAVGVFLAASRSEAAVLILMVIIMTASGRVGRVSWKGWVLMVAGVGLLVVTTPRMQRFFTLTQKGVIADRVQISVNDNFLALVEKYPLGNGLGGGGTSVPYFLQDLLRDPVSLENEYARIAAEQGIPGLLFWLGFVVWVLTRAAPRKSDPWYMGKWLARLFCAISFVTAPLGTGMLNAVPQTAILLLFAGWIAAPEVDERAALSAKASQVRPRLPLVRTA